MSSLPLVQSTLHFNTDSSAHPRDMGSFVLDLWVFSMSACLFYRSVLLSLCLCNSFASFINIKVIGMCAFVHFCSISKGQNGAFSRSWVRWGQECQDWLSRVGWVDAVPPPSPKGSRRTACWEGKTNQTPDNTDCTQAVLLICGERLNPAGLWSS